VDGASVAEIEGVKSYTTIAIIYVFGVIAGEALETKYKEMGEVDIDTLTMKHYMALTRRNQGSRIKDRLPKGSINTWALLEKAFIQKESIHDIEAGCKICQGLQLDKEYPLKEEVKGVEEAQFREFRKPFSRNGGDGARYHVGPPGYYTRVDNHPPFGETKPSLEETINKYFKESNKKQTTNE
nr:DNA-binding pseudobarrel domain-containing protein [Tanacetum cinerariifolium]